MIQLMVRIIDPLWLSILDTKHKIDVCTLLLGMHFHHFVAPSDYTQVSSILTFTSSFITQTVAVSIQNDTVFEIDEVFRTTLQLVNGYDAARVQLQPNEALVTILDNDGKTTIGLIKHCMINYKI